MTGTDWRALQRNAAQLAAEAARLSEDVDAGAAGQDRLEAVRGDLVAISRLLRALKRGAA